MKTISQKEFITKANRIHKNKFDYSKVIFINSKTKVCIVCPVHGEFWQTPKSHLRGAGCAKCCYENRSILYTLTQDKIIERFNKIHNNFYNYINTVYKDINTKVIITCPLHGDFYQKPSNHLQGQKCPKCAKEQFKLNHPTKLTLEEFIQKAIEIHGDKYYYTESIYTGMHNKLTIICKEHGRFLQTPANHLSGRGCPKCNYSKGEAALEAIFIKNNIKYEPQFKLPFYNYEYDFYLPDLNILIEFHGIQHYQPIKIFGGLEEFKEIQDRDAKKRSLAHDYRIPLIEICYKNLDLFKEQFDNLIQINGDSNVRKK